MPKPKMIGPKPPCTIEGCYKPLLARGYCGNHWALWKRNGKPETLPSPPKYNECTVDGCTSVPRSAYAEYCEVHYYRLRRTGSLADPRRISGPCRTEGCAAPATCTGGPLGEPEAMYCRLHYLRLKKRGDANFEYKGENNHHWSGEDATNGAVHQRIHKARGKASSWSCADCARPAQHWSYDRTDPEQRVDPEKGPYSLDMDRYFPRCVRCHKAFDMKHVLAERAA